MRTTAELERLVERARRSPRARSRESQECDIEALANGRDDALGRIYDRCSPSIYGLLLRMTGDRTMADQLLLDTFTIVRERAAEFEPERHHEIAWIMAIARRRALDLHIERGSLPPSGRVTIDEPSAADDPHDPLRRRVQQALARLRNEDRQSIEEICFLGSDPAEVARTRGEEEGSFRERIAAAVRSIADDLNSFRKGR